MTLARPVADPTLAIEIDRVSKLYVPGQPFRKLFARTRGKPSRTTTQAVLALNDVSFRVDRGESVAIIGRNGSGKSTLLELITGTIEPTTGCIHRFGRVAALLELGSVFDPGLSGRENVLFSALMLGLSKKETEARLPEIAAFADIGDVLDRPVSTYSTGMRMRLAFAVHVVIEPEILIVDEALNVGDFFFQQKCIRHVRSLIDKGVTLLFVSHDLALVRDLCTRALLLDNGHLAFDGEVIEACRRYYALGDTRGDHVHTPSDSRGTTAPVMSANARSECVDFEREIKRASWQKPSPPATAAARSAAELVSVTFLDSTGQPRTQFRIGERLVVRALYVAYEPRQVHVTVELTNRHGLLVSCFGTYTQGVLDDGQPEARPRACEVEAALDIEAGEYGIRILLGHSGAQVNRGVTLDASPQLGPIRVLWNYDADRAPHFGLCRLQHHVRFLDVSTPAS